MTVNGRTCRRTCMAATLSVLLVAACFGLGAPIVGAATARASKSKFCDQLADFAGSLPSSLAAATPAKALALGRLLDRVRALSPKSTRKPVALLASELRAFGHTTSAEARAAVVTKSNAAYAAALAVLVAYNSNYCPVPVPTSPNLPGVGAAREIACVSDSERIKLAENLYETVNGTFATIPDLVTAQYLRQASSYFSDVRIGYPPGGYTLVAVPSGPCADLPVGG